MKTLFFLLLVGISNCYGQNPETDQHANFHVAGKSGYWTKRYSISNAPIKDGILSSGNLRNLLQGEQKVYADLIDYIPKKGADLVSGKVIVVPDSAGYIVTVKDLNFKPGASKAAFMTMQTGVQSTPANPFDYMFVKDGKLKPKGYKSLEFLNDHFTQLFEFHE